MTSTAHAEAIAPTSDLVKVSRALVSVSDKAGIIELAKTLAGFNIEIISTGGTAKAIADAGIPVIPIDEVTGFPEMMDGRVKTLHPKIHGGLLARRDLQDHVQSMTEHDIKPIDLVIVNLYPFESTISKDGVTDAEAIEQIDIGGPSMVRSAAKNHNSVAIVTDPSQYESVIAQLKANDGKTTLALRKQLAAQAFVQTASYDSIIAQWMTRNDVESPSTLTLSYRKVDDLRYGENPHQSAASYRAIGAPKGTLIDATQLHGKPLSFNNLNDASAALELVRAISRVKGTQHAAIVLKHTNPCGAASSSCIATAIDRAIEGDPMAAFGGILATSTPIDLAGAQRIAAEGTFFEVVIAPSYAPDALELLQQRWKNLRILAVGGSIPQITTEAKYFPGGLLVQDRDLVVPDPTTWVHAAGPSPSEEQLAGAAMLETVCRSLSSNAVLVGGMDNGSARLYGAGAGQMDRVASCMGAVRKAGELSKGSIALSDAFFPFADGPQILIDAGVSMIVHPGGSKRDEDTFDLCSKHNVTCMTTSIRHFRH
jgi:phosphoribosylaminoimidazolecarboxamide formyltransferase/IMP cyclohydrolase